MIHLTRVAPPMSTSDPTAWAVEAEARLWDAVLVEKLGEADLSNTVAERISWGMTPEYSTIIRIVASDVAVPSSDAEVVGVATVGLPMSDNLHLADLSWVVQADRRGEGIGRMLLDELLRLASEQGRTALEAFTWEPVVVPEGADVIAAGTGEGAVDAGGRESRFLSRAGFRLNQIERLSRLTLATADELRRVSTDVRGRTSPEYDCITTFGPVPDELVDRVALLHVRMSTDVPVGDIHYEAESWDAARIRAEERSVAAGDCERLQTFVRHIPTGDLVAYTQLVKDRAIEHVVHQWDTLVAGEHRGHGLGMLAKAANHAAIAEHWPAARHVITGNAAENRYMLAINVELGFEPYARAASWVRELAG